MLSPSSLLLDECVDDEGDEDDVDGPLVGTLTEGFLQRIPDGIEVENQQQDGDGESDQHPRLELKGLLLFHCDTSFSLIGKRHIIVS